MDYRNFLFEFDISPGETRQIYLRFQSHDGLHEPSPIILWDKQSFALANGVRNLGMGLSICKKLTEALSGELKFVSILGKGSTFTVMFPIEPGIEPVIQKAAALASADLPMLIVEDNIVNQKVLAKLLNKIGYRSLIVNHGKEALEILEKEVVSLILMDIQMPVMDGLTCTAKIRERSDELKNIPIIAITANLMDAEKERCIACGMNDFIKKPIRLDRLRNCLSDYVESVPEP